MGGGPVIIREAFANDHPRLLPFLRRELAAWGYDHKLNTEKMNHMAAQGFRYAFVEEEGQLAAALIVQPVRTDRGPAVQIILWLVAFDHPRKLLAFDALALWGCNLMRSEGIRIVFSRRDLARAQFDAAGHFGMAVVDEGFGADPPSLLQWGDTEQVIAHILNRRPEWARSL